MKKILILAAMVTLCVTANAQRSYKLSDYVFSGVGDQWQYKNLTPDGLSPIKVGVSAKVEKNGRNAFKRDENNGDYRIQGFDKMGLTIYELYFIGDRIVEYEKPILLMPGRLKIGETYRSASRYTTRVKGEVKERGSQTYEVTALGVEDAQTPLGAFKNCLVIKTVALRIDESGTRKGYELREWHAKGIGAVKVEGKLFWANDKGETTRIFRVDAELEKAIVSGKEQRAK